MQGKHSTSLCMCMATNVQAIEEIMRGWPACWLAPFACCFNVVFTRRLTDSLDEAEVQREKNLAGVCIGGSNLLRRNLLRRMQVPTKQVQNVHCWAYVQKKRMEMGALPACSSLLQGQVTATL